MNHQDESAHHEQAGRESREAPAPAPRREPPRKRAPTVFPKSEQAVSQADGDA